MTLSPTGPWDLPIDGFEILTIVFTFPIDIVAYGEGGPRATVRLAGPFKLSEPDGHVHDLDSEHQSWEELGVLLTLRHDASAWRSRSLGRVYLRFSLGGL